jgi:hypothetical protein
LYRYHFLVGRSYRHDGCGSRTPSPITGLHQEPQPHFQRWMKWKHNFLNVIFLGVSNMLILDVISTRNSLYTVVKGSLHSYNRLLLHSMEGYNRSHSGSQLTIWPSCTESTFCIISYNSLIICQCSTCTVHSTLH